MIRRILAAVLSAAVLSIGMVVVSAAPATAAGGWRIDSKPSGRCLTPSGDNTVDRNISVVLSTAPCRLTWNVVDVPGQDYKFIKLDANPNRCLVPSGSSVESVRIVTGACFDLPAFHWRPILVSEPDSPREWYVWENQASWLCLAVADPVMPAGTPIVQKACDWPYPETLQFARSVWPA